MGFPWEQAGRQRTSLAEEPSVALGDFLTVKETSTPKASWVNEGSYEKRWLEREDSPSLSKHIPMDEMY